MLTTEYVYVKFFILHKIYVNTVRVRFYPKIQGSIEPNRGVKKYAPCGLTQRITPYSGGKIANLYKCQVA